jgi:hypothetical protein
MEGLKKQARSRFLEHIGTASTPDLFDLVDIIYRTTMAESDFLCGFVVWRLQTTKKPNKYNGRTAGLLQGGQDFPRDFATKYATRNFVDSTC